MNESVTNFGVIHNISLGLVDNIKNFIYTKYTCNDKIRNQRNEWVGSLDRSIDSLKIEDIF